MEIRISNPFSSSSPRRQPPTSSWVIVVLLMLTTLVPRLHGNQSPCTYNEAHTAANCTNKNLDYVPWRLHKNINSLDLSSNNFSVLDNKSFTAYAYVTDLSLRNNSMHQIKLNAFLKLNYLRTLDLSNNKLTQIPTDSLNVVSHSLEQLILAGNKLSTIPENAFSRLTKLKLLDLSGNSIYHIDPGAFAGLSSLTVFKIRHNAIKSLPSDSFDSFPKDSMTQVQLYDNRWICDCRLQWLWKWLNATDTSVWESPGYPIRCDGPTLVGDESLDSLPLEKLACPVQMKTSGSTRVLNAGGNTTLLCKYTTVPKVEAVWMKNSDVLDVRGRKYSVYFEETKDTRGNVMYVSELRINDFKREDIARYKCRIENIRGEAYSEYKLTLKGVDFDSVVDPRVSHNSDDSAGVDKQSVIIAVAVVFGIILIILIGVLIFCSVNRVQRKKQAKRDAIVEHVKEHFIKNSDVIGTGDTSTLDKSKSALLSRGLQGDGTTGNGSPGGGMMTVGNNNVHHHHPQHHNPHHYEDTRSNHTNDSTYKPPLDPEESEPMLIMSPGGHHSPGSPLNNGNTYVSFGSEFTDPGEFPTHVPVYTNTNPHQTPILGGGGNHYDLPDGRNDGSVRYGPMTGSQEGSATPLLDRFTPVFLDDSDEPVEDYASYPVYDSLTNSLQHPRHTNTPPATVYNNNVDGGRIYGTLPAHSHQPIHPRGGSVASNGYNSTNHNRSLGSQSSFNYPPSQSGCGSMPRTPGSVRSVAAVPPWNVNSNSQPPPPPHPSSGGPGNGSPPIIENHYHPPPLVHRPHPEYRDYRDMRYPITSPNPGVALPPSNTATPPLNRDVAHTRTLGYNSPAPSASSSSGPKKPPRVYIPGNSSNNSNGSGSSSSRDCIEMSVAPPQPHDSTSSDYITSSEAQQYSKNYGITPGTPV